MKVGLVLDDTLDSPDGVQQYVLTIGTWLESQGHDVHYLVGHTERTDLKNIHSLSRNLKVRFNQNTMSMPLPASRHAIRTLLATEKFDVLHVQMPYSPFLAGRIIAAAPVGTRIVGTFHILPVGKIQYVGARLLGMYLHRNLQRFSAICAVSEPAKDFAKRTFGIDAAVIPNAVELARFSSSTRPQRGKDVLTIVFLGRLVERKGCQYLVRAIDYLKTTDRLASATRVIIAGKGSMRQELENYVNTHGLSNQVEFVGFIPEEQKADLLALADIAVFPSTAGESFGIVLVEAMAAGAGVVIGGDNPGYRSVLSGYDGLLCKPTDIRAFGDLLADYLAHPDKIAAAHQWQAEHVRQYDTPVVGAQLLDLYSGENV